MEIINATIKNAEIQLDYDGAFLTAWIDLDYDGAGQGFGGFCFDQFDKTQNKRVGTAWGCEYIRQILEVIGVMKWSDLKGKNVRVKQDSNKVYAIGHIIKNRWFDPKENLKFLEPEEHDV